MMMYFPNCGGSAVVYKHGRKVSSFTDAETNHYRNNLRVGEIIDVNGVAERVVSMNWTRCGEPEIVAIHV